MFFLRKNVQKAVFKGSARI